MIENGNFWTAVGGVSLVAMALLAVLGRLRWRGLVLGLVVLGAGLAGTLVYAPLPGDALVVEEGVAMQVSPIDGGETKGTLEAGERVRVENRHEGYAYVRGQGGEAGWVPTVTLDRYFGDWEE